MIIHGIDYQRMDDEILCSTSACLYMLLKFYGIKSTSQEVAREFSDIIMSTGFNRWYIQSLDMDKHEDNAMLCAAQYMIESRFPGMTSSILSTNIERINLSYSKRKMPVLLEGKFPLLSGKIPNTILVKGYIDKYLVVNDPRGNAYSGYIDRYGENMVYAVDDIRIWLGSSHEVNLLRIVESDYLD